MLMSSTRYVKASPNNGKDNSNGKINMKHALIITGTLTHFWEGGEGTLL